MQHIYKRHNLSTSMIIVPKHALLSFEPFKLQINRYWGGHQLFSPMIFSFLCLLLFCSLVTEDSLHHHLSDWFLFLFVLNKFLYFIKKNHEEKLGTHCVHSQSFLTLYSAYCIYFFFQYCMMWFNVYLLLCLLDCKSLNNSTWFRLSSLDLQTCWFLIGKKIRKLLLRICH